MIKICSVIIVALIFFPNIVLASGICTERMAAVPHPIWGLQSNGWQCSLGGVFDLKSDCEYACSDNRSGFKKINYEDSEKDSSSDEVDDSESSKTNAPDRA